MFSFTIFVIKSARPCYLFCKRPGCYHSASKIHASDRNFKLSPIHVSFRKNSNVSKTSINFHCNRIFHFSIKFLLSSTFSVCGTSLQRLDVICNKCFRKIRFVHQWTLNTQTYILCIVQVCILISYRDLFMNHRKNALHLDP